MGIGVTAEQPAPAPGEGSQEGLGGVIQPEEQDTDQQASDGRCS